MALSFGVTVLPDPPYGRMIELIQLAERHGFEYAWTYDSHVLWQESFPVMALVADRTSTIKLGHMVTNPGTREPTVLASAYATLHDAAEVSRAGIPTVMLFVQSLRGLSHTKLEDTKEEHLELSVQALDRLTSKALEAFA